MVRMMAISLVIFGCSDKKAAAPASQAAPSVPRASKAGPAPASTAPAAATVAVSALDLVKDYKTDSVSADDKYRNRVLLVTGTVGQVDKDTLGMDDPGFVIFTTAAGDASANVGAASKALKRGQKVTLRCTGKGFLADTAMLDSCAVAQ